MPRSSNTTTVGAATKGATSLKTVIPMWAVNKLGIKAGDKLDWDLDKVGDEWVLLVKVAE